MSKIYVSEFANLAGTDQGDSVPLLAVPALASYTVVVSAGVSQGQNLQPGTKFVELSTDTTASFRIDTAAGGSCTLTDCRLNANERIIRRVIYNQQPAGGYGASVLATAFAIFTTANV